MSKIKNKKEKEGLSEKIGKFVASHFPINPRSHGESSIERAKDSVSRNFHPEIRQITQLKDNSSKEEIADFSLQQSLEHSSERQLGVTATTSPKIIAGSATTSISSMADKQLASKKIKMKDKDDDETTVSPVKAKTLKIPWIFESPIVEGRIDLKELISDEESVTEDKEK